MTLRVFTSGLQMGLKIFLVFRGMKCSTEMRCHKIVGGKQCDCSRRASEMLMKDVVHTFSEPGQLVFELFATRFLQLKCAYF